MNGCDQYVWLWVTVLGTDLYSPDGVMQLSMQRVGNHVVHITTLVELYWYIARAAIWASGTLIGLPKRIQPSSYERQPECTHPWVPIHGHVLLMLLLAGLFCGNLPPLLFWNCPRGWSAQNGLSIAAGALSEEGRLCSYMFCA